MNFTIPAPNDTFVINEAPIWPLIPFQTDAAGPHTWNWQLAWGIFTKCGSASTNANRWDGQSAITNFGGTLTVTARANGQTATLVVEIQGTNPSVQEVSAFLAAQPNSDGFDRILMQESHCRHFNAAGEPIKSFDNGYGMCQLTNPRPTFDQVWNWKSNLQAGLALFASKQTESIAYLSQSGRSYTAEQLRYESVSRWNGGSYHEWDDANSRWIRHANMLCDPATGNIGWDLSDPQNTGKTAAQLHHRDYPYPPKPRPSDHWKYSGVCYADKVLG